MKEIIESIVYPLALMFNLSLKTGYIPSDYKCAKIIPIFKTEKKINLITTDQLVFYQR